MRYTLTFAPRALEDLEKINILQMLGHYDDK
jgi:hypothetical protein